MDKTMTRRIIGAIVLVLVAALVLAALLRGKSKQQEIVDVSTPASPILQFPNDTQNDGTMDANQDAMQQANPDQNVAGDDAEKVGFDVTQNGTSGGDSMTGGVSQSGGSGSSSMSSTPGSSEVIAENEKTETSTSGTNTGTSSGSATAGLSENDKLDLNGTKDKVSPTEAKKEEKAPKAELVNEPKTSKVGEKPKTTPKPKKEEKATENDDASPQNGYSIQLVAVTNKAKAVAIKKQMIDEGYPAYVSTTTKDGKSFYRVRIGSYPDKAAAEEVQARMKRRYLQNAGVQNSIVLKN